MRAPRFSRSLAGAGLALLAVGLVVAPSAAAQAAPAPRTVDVVVVPNLAGVQFTLDGIPGVTAAGGVAQVNDPNLSSAAANVSVPQQVLLGPDQHPDLRVSLDRVTSDPNHGVFSRKLVVELDAERAVSIQLLTPQGKPLPLGQVSSVTLNDSVGRTIKLARAQLKGPVWLSSSRPSPVANGVADRNITYSVQSAIISGTNAVNSGQLRFDTRRSLTWSVPVILHSLTIVGNDLMAARPAGSSVKLTYPNGTVRVVPFGPGHRVTLTDLPRGSYGVKVQGGLLPLASTVRLSKDQTATEIVVTAGNAVEIMAIVLVVASVIVAAGVIGRRRRRALQRVDSAGPAEPEVTGPTGGVGGAALV
ncbi:MAG: hypothetical protein ACRDYE_00110 [Acidimicrobiales bacterium]